MQHDKLYVQGISRDSSLYHPKQFAAGGFIAVGTGHVRNAGREPERFAGSHQVHGIDGNGAVAPGARNGTQGVQPGFCVPERHVFHGGRGFQGDSRNAHDPQKLELAYMREAYHSLKPEDIAHIREILERIKHEWQQHIFFHADDKDFHMALFSRLNNPTLLSLMDAIWSVDENFQKEEKFKYLDDTVIKHEKIVHALEAHNEEAFVAAMLTHFSSGKYTSQDSFEEY